MADKVEKQQGNTWDRSNEELNALLAEGRTGREVRRQILIINAMGGRLGKVLLCYIDSENHRPSNVSHSFTRIVMTSTTLTGVETITVVVVSAHSVSEVTSGRRTAAVIAF